VSTVTFGDLARAAYCPRQLYYARRDDDRGPPDRARERIALAYAYPELRDATDERLRAAPIDRDPAAYRRALDRLADRDDWAALAEPSARRVRLVGTDCRGIAHKILVPGADDGHGDGADDGDHGDDGDDGGWRGAGGTPVPTVVSPGTPPERGVWEPQAVRAVAVAKAVARERVAKEPVGRALVEYPAVGVVRTVRLTTRRRAAYRRVLRTVRSIDGPPPRVDDARCDACDYSEECGVRTRSLRSLLGL